MSTNLPPPGPTLEFMKALIDGIPQLPSTLTAVSVLGTTYSMAALSAKVTSYETVYATEATAALAATTALEARNAIEPDAVAFMAAVKVSLKAALGRKTASLTLVGIKPDKVPAALTAEQKIKKVAQAKATRAARHTVGKKAKSKIKGQVPPATPNSPASPGG